MKRIAVVAGCLLALAAAGVGGYVWYNRPGRGPDINKVGGTVLTYELAGEGHDLREMDDGLARLFDPRRVNGIRARAAGDGRVEIVIPDTGAHAWRVRLIEEALAGGGLELIILANRQDDFDAFQAAEKDMKDSGDAWARLAREGRPPPPPRSPKGGGLPAVLGGKVSWHAYRWLRLSAVLADEWRAPAGDAPKHLADCLVYDPPGEGPAFVLARLAPEGEDVTGRHLVYANEGLPAEERAAVDFKLTKDGGDRLYALTSRNQPTDGFHRLMAVVIAGRVVSAPRLNSAIREHGQITGRFSDEEIGDMLASIRAGILAAKLKPGPAARRVVAPAE